MAAYRPGAQRATFKKQPQPKVRSGLFGPNSQQSFKKAPTKAPVNKLTGGSARPGRPGSAPAAPKARGAAAPVGQHFEPDEAYNRTINRSTRVEGERLSSIAGERQQTEHEFGINDPTNPMSRAQGLKQAYLSRRKAASAGLASQGQLYSGAHERALAKTRADEEQSYNDLRNAYMGAIGGLNEKERETKYASEEERERAFQDWLERAPEADEPLDEGVDEEASVDEAAPAPLAATRQQQGAQVITQQQAGALNQKAKALSKARAKKGATKTSKGQGFAKNAQPGIKSGGNVKDKNKPPQKNKPKASTPKPPQKNKPKAKKR
jgi:hypothetical protein